jgi:hypothetical protein
LNRLQDTLLHGAQARGPAGRLLGVHFTLSNRPNWAVIETLF